jgi:hypothetical protein
VSSVPRFTTHRDPKYPRLAGHYTCNTCGAERKNKGMMLSHLAYHHNPKLETTTEMPAEPKITKFTNGSNRGTRRCSNCQKNTWQSKIHEMGGGYNLCDDCYEEAGLENEHVDGHHDPVENGPNSECPMCQSDEIARKIEQVREQAEIDKKATEAAPKIIEETVFISRKTRKILFIDLETGEAHYKHQTFDRHYQYRVTEVQSGYIYGYRIQPDGTRYQGTKGEDKMIISLKRLEESPNWKIVEEAEYAPIPDDGGDDPQESDDGTDRNWSKRP